MQKKSIAVLALALGAMGVMLMAQGVASPAWAATDGTTQPAIAGQAETLEARVARLEGQLKLSPPAARASLDDRVKRIELLLTIGPAVAEPTVMAAPPANDSVAANEAKSGDTCGDAVDVPITTVVYGNINLQWQNGRTHNAVGPPGNYSDIHQYDSEIGLDTSDNDWSGHLSLTFDDTADAIAVKEGWVKFQRKDSPWYFQAGQIEVPFGNNPHYFPTYSATHDLGDSTLHAIGGGYDNSKHAFSAYLYSPPVEVIGESKVMRDYTVVWDVTKRAVSECGDGWKFTLGYNSNLPQHDLRLSASDPLAKRLPGANAFAGYDFHAGCGLVHLIADYTQALQRFAPADLDADADGVGDRPQALNAELVFEPRADHLWGVSYQTSEKMKDYSGKRWGLLYGRRLDKMAKLKVEYTHGKFNSYATTGQRHDDTLVSEIKLAF